MALRAFRWAYLRTGGRYVRGVLWLQLQLAHLVVLAGIGLLTIYQPLGSDFWRVVLVAEGLMAVENLLAFVHMSRCLRPADAWLRGERTPAAAEAAWRALAALPRSSVGHMKYVSPAVNIAPFCLITAALLDLGTTGTLALFAGGLVVLVYGLFLRFFAMELALRPVLEDVSCDLPAGFGLRRAGVSLRTRLLVALPLLNVITGVVVAGVSARGDVTLEDLGLAVVVAVVVAFTVTLELTLLLARSVVDPIVELEGATRRVSDGDLEVRVPVATDDETGRLAVAFNEAVEGLAERARLREAFGAYVDPDVARRILREGVSLEGEEVDVTVLFLDIRGFTAMAERSSAREVVTRLNAFFDVVVPILVRHGGHADKYVGDGLLGVFGAPERMTDHADRAVAAALEMLAAVRDRWGDDLRIGVGVNSGPVVAGTVGGGGRYEFTVIGDAVNTAARVEAATRMSGDELLITADTLRLLRTSPVDWEERSGLPLRGKTRSVALYAPAGANRPAASAGREFEVA